MNWLQRKRDKDDAARINHAERYGELVRILAATGDLNDKQAAQATETLEQLKIQPEWMENDAHLLRTVAELEPVAMKLESRKKVADKSRLAVEDAERSAQVARETLANQIKANYEPLCDRRREDAEALAVAEKAAAEIETIKSSNPRLFGRPLPQRRRAFLTSNEVPYFGDKPFLNRYGLEKYDTVFSLETILSGQTTINPDLFEFAKCPRGQTVEEFETIVKAVEQKLHWPADRVRCR